MTKGRVVVIDKLPKFRLSAKKVLGDALREAGTDVLINTKERAPFKKGGLRGESHVKPIHPLLYRVSFWMEYARFQEFGGDSKRRVRKYTTSGTGKHYLKSSGDEAVDKLNLTFAKHGRRARA